MLSVSSISVMGTLFLLNTNLFFMNFFENIINSIVTIVSNKLRSGLTMLGIIIGVSSVIVMIAIGEGAQKGVTSRIEEMGTNLLIVSPGSSSQTNVRGGSGGNSSTDSLTNDDISSLLSLDGIVAVSPEKSGRKQVIYTNKNVNTTITGVYPSYEFVRNFKVEYGQFITEQHNKEFSRVAVLGNQVVTDLFDGANPIGKDIRIENNIFTVVGVMEKKESQGSSNTGNFIFIPISTAQMRVFGSASLNNIFLSVADANEMESMKEKVELALLTEHQISDPTHADFTVLNQADTLETLNQVTAIFTLLLGGIAGISLLVGGIGVMNIMLVSVTERTHEIGIRKAIGAKERDILVQFLTESTLLSLAGGFLGILISFGVVAVLASKTTLEASITTNSILLAFFFAASVGMFFGAYPAYKAGKLNPIEALRFE